MLDSQGTVRETISGHGINGPWDMTAFSVGPLSRAVRHQRAQRDRRGERGRGQPGHGAEAAGADLGEQPAAGCSRSRRIGSGFAEQTDPAAFVVGPTGVGLGFNGTLYVADTDLNRITAIPHAVTRLTSAGTGRW